MRQERGAALTASPQLLRALACLLLCALQGALCLLLLAWEGPWAGGFPWRWQAVAVQAALVALLLLLLAGQLLRVLRWRPRRSKRLAREVTQERQRIARDLHDQVGSQIVGAMALLDPGDAASQPLASALERCLLNLRMVVDATGGDDDDLLQRLAQLRHRLQPALDRRGIALHWRVTLEPGVPWLVGEPARQLAFIAQEAVSNVLQHAQASELTVALQSLPLPQGPGLCLQISDNGRGMPAALRAGGAAGTHMRQRAAGMGAALELLAAPGGGLCVRVTLGWPSQPVPGCQPVPHGKVCASVPAGLDALARVPMHGG